MHESPRLLIDVSDTFAKFSGSPTGIQRTLLCLARASADSPQQVMLAVLDKQQQCLKHVPLPLFLAVFTKTLSDRIRTSSSYKIKPILKLIGQLMPYAFSDTFRNAMLTDRNRNYSRGTRHLKSIRTTEQDALLIADSAWNIPHYITSIKRLKAQSGLTVCGFVHDIIPITFPHFVDKSVSDQLYRWILDLACASDIILANSDYTTNELSAFLAQEGIQEKPLRSIRFGNEPTTANKSTNYKQETVRLLLSSNKKLKESLKRHQGNIILIVGSLDMRKNVETALHAYTAANKLCLDLPPLVVVGRASRGAENIVSWLTRHPLLKKKAAWVQDASDEDLEALYASASLLLQPSWAEGYGLPVEEALVRGIPCLVSDSTSLPEVGGPSCEYFAPYDVAKCSELLVRFHSDGNYANLLKLKARNHPRKSWHQYIDEIVISVSTLKDTS